jgi:hypothetical protein
MSGKSSFIDLMGLYIHKDRNGNQYLAGNLNGARISIFKNKNKTSSKQPDYRVCISENEGRKKNAARDNESQPTQETRASERSRITKGKITPEGEFNF